MKNKITEKNKDGKYKRLRNTQTGEEGIFDGVIYDTNPPTYGIKKDDGSLSRIFEPCVEIIK